MRRSLLWALLLIGLVILVLLYNQGHLTLNLVFTEIRAPRAVVLLGFTAVGVLIGILLR